MIFVSLYGIFKLLFLFQLKHFLCDYPFQTRYMIGKFKADWNFFPHLAAHALVHALGTFMVIWCLGRDMAQFFQIALQLAVFDGMIHFIVDRVKASPNLLGRFQALSKETYAQAVQENNTGALLKNTLYWCTLGLDQMIHHLTHYAMILWFLLYSIAIR